MKLIKKLTGDFTVVANIVSRNPKISDQCKGLYLIMVGLPDNWKFSINGLKRFTPSGKDKLSSSLKEMEAWNLLIRNRYKDSKGQWKWDYYITDELEYIGYKDNETDSDFEEEVIEDTDDSGKPAQNSEELAGQPCPDYPSTGNPSTGNTPIYKNKTKKINKENNNKENITAKPVDEVAEIIKKMESVDIQNKTMYGNTTQRKAAKLLLDTYGKDTVFQAIEVVIRFKDNKPDYFPTIYTTDDLLKKWSKLKNFFNTQVKEAQQKQSKILRSLG